MSLERFFYERGRIIETATDPVGTPSNRVNAESLWLDTSYSTPRLRERNATNTAWNVAGPFSGLVTITVAGAPLGEASWAGTVNDPDIKATSEVTLTAHANGTGYGLVVVLVSVADGSFSWDMGSFGLVPPTTTLYIHYTVHP